MERLSRKTERIEVKRDDVRRRRTGWW